MSGCLRILLWAHDVDIFTSGASTYAIVTASCRGTGVQIIDVSDPDRHCSIRC